MEPEAEGIVARAIEPDGRTVELTEAAWIHIMSEHPEMAEHQQAIMQAVTHPDHRENDVRPSRERFFRRGIGPSEWLRIVVAFEGAAGRVVTAFGQRNEP